MDDYPSTTPTEEDAHTDFVCSEETLKYPEEEGRVDSGFHSGQGLADFVLPTEIQAFVPNNEGDHILHLAVAQTHFAALRWSFAVIDSQPILRNCVNDQNDLGQTPLHIAVHTNEPAIVKDLVSRGAQLDLVDRHGNTPIHVACRKGLVKVLDVFSSVAPLRRIRAAAELRNVQGLSCPHLGVMSTEKGVAQWLHSVGVDMNMQESGSGRTALHFAIESGTLPMATCLVTECEVEVDVPTYSGYTPLHMAAGGDKKELVAYLIAMGADPYMQTDEEEMPEDLTQDGEVTDILHKVKSTCWLNGN